ncbi:MAG TPA: nuclear transport factor 2 family protein [Mycobacteriales bacterium]|nr:nuclear transport factor 2 family protein [Mycobacteriales bacterium]
MTDKELLAELDRDIYEPFRAAYRSYDTEAYLALHTPDLIRVGGPGRTVQGYAEVAAEVGPWFADAAATGLPLAIDFRFTERLADGDRASDRGVYRIEVDGAVLHGRFHTFSRKDGGRWRMVVDYDSDDGATLTDADWAALA